MVFKLFSSSYTDTNLEKAQQESNGINEQIQVSVDQLDAVVEQIKIAAHSLENISSSNQKSSYQLKNHSEKTNDYTQKVKGKMEDIQLSSIKVSTISDQVLQDSLSSGEDVQVAFAALQTLKLKIETLQKGHHSLLQQMENLVAHSIKTIGIVQNIGSISQKTRVLALNASIEAARAGIHGKGFNVVANEVGNLANLTSDAVNETGINIKIIQEEIMKSTEMVKEESKQVEDGAKEITNVLTNFNTLQNKLNHIQASITDTNTAVSSQTENITEITYLLNDISDMSMENTEQVSQVSQKLDEQHTNIEQIIKITSTLTNTSNELQHLVNNDDTPQGKFIYDTSHIDLVKERLSRFLTNSKLEDLDTSNHEHTLNQFLHTEKNIEAIWSNRNDGTFIYSNPPAGLVNAKARPWFKNAMKGEMYVSEVYTSALTKKKCITISCAILNQGEIYGVVGVDLALINN